MVATLHSVFQSATGVRAMTLEVMKRRPIVRSGQQREGLRIEDAGPNELVNVVAEGMDLL